METEPKKTRAPRKKKVAPDTTEPVPQKRKRATKLKVVREIEPSKSLVLKKAVEAVGMRNVSTTGDFTFLQRKIYNSLLQFAQQQPETEMIHNIPLKELEELLCYETSNSRESLKKVLRSMAQVQVEFDYKGDSPGRQSGWGIANLIAEVYILEDNQTVRYSFPAELKRRLLDPSIFNLIDLRMQYHFTSYSALALHEVVSRYFGFTQGETFREHWTAWSLLLSGSAKPHTEFRDFNKMLGRAVEQVNSIEKRFQIEAVVTRVNRKIEKLWFKLETIKQPELLLASEPQMIGSEVIKRLRALSLSASDIEEYGMNYDEEYLLAQVDYTEAQIKKKKDAVASPVAYFKAAVANNYAKAPVKDKKTLDAGGEAPGAETKKRSKKGATEPKVSQGSQMNALLEQWASAQRNKIREEFTNLGPEDQQALLEKYEPELKKNDLAYKQYRSKGLNAMVQSCLVGIIFDERFTEAPSSDELLNFLLASTGSVHA